MLPIITSHISRGHRKLLLQVDKHCTFLLLLQVKSVGRCGQPPFPSWWRMNTKLIYLHNNISLEAQLGGRSCDLNSRKQGQEPQPDLLRSYHSGQQAIELQCEEERSITLPAVFNRSSRSCVLHEAMCAHCDLSILFRSDLWGERAPSLRCLQVCSND